jgi:H+-transporting ATPase
MSATTPPNHLGTDVPTSELNEKKDYGAPEKKAVVEDEEEDEDMDALIEELESQDANIDDEEEEEAVAGGARNVPEELLQTSTRDGLTSAEVLQRRKKFGMNQMKEEKENLILKFLGFFIGPIQFVMEAAAVLAGKTHSSCFRATPRGYIKFRCLEILKVQDSWHQGI